MNKLTIQVFGWEEKFKKILSEIFTAQELYEFELEKIDLYDTDFWVKHRKYFQKEKFLKYNLFKRLGLWEQISEQLVDYDATLERNIKKLDSVIQTKEDEFVFIYWWF